MARTLTGRQPLFLAAAPTGTRKMSVGDKVEDNSSKPWPSGQEGNKKRKI